MFFCELSCVEYSTTYIGYSTLHRQSAFLCRIKISCCSGLGLGCCARLDCKYVALLIDAVCWVCAAASEGITWYVALLFTAVDLTCAAAPDEIAWYLALLLAAVGWPALQRPKGSNGKLLCYNLQRDEPALLCQTRLHATLLCNTAVVHAAGAWACATAFDWIAWYVALLHAAWGWVCAAALDENTWYVALLHAAWGLICAAAPKELAWYIELLQTATPPPRPTYTHTHSLQLRGQAMLGHGPQYTI